MADKKFKKRKPIKKLDPKDRRKKKPPKRKKDVFGNVISEGTDSIIFNCIDDSEEDLCTRAENEAPDTKLCRVSTIIFLLNILIIALFFSGNDSKTVAWNSAPGSRNLLKLERVPG